MSKTITFRSQEIAEGNSIDKLQDAVNSGDLVEIVHADTGIVLAYAKHGADALVLTQLLNQAAQHELKKAAKRAKKNTPWLAHLMFTTLTPVEGSDEPKKGKMFGTFIVREATEEKAKRKANALFFGPQQGEDMLTPTDERITWKRELNAADGEEFTEFAFEIDEVTPDKKQVFHAQVWRHVLKDEKEPMVIDGYIRLEAYSKRQAWEAAEELFYDKDGNAKIERNDSRITWERPLDSSERECGMSFELESVDYVK